MVFLSAILRHIPAKLNYSLHLHIKNVSNHNNLQQLLSTFPSKNCLRHCQEHKVQCLYLGGDARKWWSTTTISQGHH